MGDLIQNFDHFKKLGFDSSNQWIFYDERFEKFFSFFADNITDVNILTEHEVLERDELIRRNEYLDAQQCQEQLQQLEREYPGLMEYTESDVEELSEEIKMLEREEEMYTSLLEDMVKTKNKINKDIIELEDNITELMNDEKDLMTTCLEKSRKLEELQKENSKLCNESKECFTKMQSPPLFVHQLPLDQYFLKCDSFMQYFTLYVKENFKIQEFIELDNNESEIKDVAEKLENLRKTLQHYTLAYIKEKAKAKATQSLIDLLDMSQIHVMSLADMERETRELELVNEHHLKNATETLLNDLEIHVQQRTQQQMELILYENTKQKLNRALARRENDKRLTKIVSDALSNAELVWILTQLDLEKVRNRFDNTEQLHTEAQRCLRRIDAMKQIQQQTPQSSASELFVEKIAEILSPHLGTRVRPETKCCLYEYEKFCRLSKYSLQSLLNRKSYTPVLEMLNDLSRIEQILKPWVYDSPVEAPMFENVRFLKPIFNAKMKQKAIEKKLRNLRIQFQENVTERMTNDKLWRYSQLLWMWFLTEPKRVLMAIEEAKKAASKVPSMTGVKSLGGIKRK